MQLTYRLQVLKETNQISCENYTTMLKVIDMFSEKYNLELTEENSAMFITHLAVAYERILNNKYIDAINDNIYNEIRDSWNFDKSVEILEEIQEIFPRSIHENEKPYILMHLCVLLNK